MQPHGVTHSSDALSTYGTYTHEFLHARLRSRLLKSCVFDTFAPPCLLRFFVPALSLSFSRLTSTWTWRHGRLFLCLVCFGARLRTVDLPAGRLRPNGTYTECCFIVFYSSLCSTSDFFTCSRYGYFYVRLYCTGFRERGLSDVLVLVWPCSCWTRPLGIGRPLDEFLGARGP